MKLRIHSNFAALDSLLRDDPRFEHVYIGPEHQSWRESLRRLWQARASADYLLLNIDHRRLALACLLFGVFQPRPLRRCRIVSVDILLRPARSFLARIANRLKGLLYRQIDLFILYFRNIDGYVKHFGISRERTVYVPFKVNNWERLRSRRSLTPDGDYVLLAGATLRDRATFVAAVKKAGVPAVLLLPGSARAEVESLSWYRQGLPPNLRVDFHTDGKEETYIRYIEEARVVCLPRFAWDIASSGISGYLCAMALGKFVAISRGPGAEDVLAESEAAAFFDPGNAEELATVIRQAWDQPEYRRRIAANGARYAESLAGEERLLRDILAVLTDLKERRS